MIFASPCCKAELDGALACTQCRTQYPTHAGIPVLMSAETRASATHQRFDAKYRTDDRDPWGYERRAAEVLKYEFLFQTVAALLPGRYAPAADIGCAQGLLSTRLAELTDRAAAIDLSPSAVAGVKARVGARLEVAAASALALPFREGSMQLLVLSDGLVSWGLDEADRVKAAKEARRALKPGGRALFMDYLNPRRHGELIDPVAAAFEIERIEYLHDRLWYVSESMFRALSGTAPVRAITRSVGWARALRQASKVLGARGSKHLCVIARR